MFFSCRGPESRRKTCFARFPNDRCLCEPHRDRADLMEQVDSEPAIPLHTCKTPQSWSVLEIYCPLCSFNHRGSEFVTIYLKKDNTILGAGFENGWVFENLRYLPLL